MSRTFKINRKYYDDNTLYKKSSFTLEPGITVLVGCNGAGKSTMLREIERQLEAEDIEYITYDNEHDGGSHSMQKAGFYGDMDLLGSLFMSSEGEKISINIGQQARKIGAYVKKNLTSPEIWIILDAVDSGLSIDNIVEIKEDLFKTILSDKRIEGEVYVVCSANTYEMVSGLKCFDVYNQEYIEFGNYDEFKKFILNCRKRKDKRR